MADIDEAENIDHNTNNVKLLVWVCNVDIIIKNLL